MSRTNKEGVFRAIDASADRGMEAVRVIEDIFRFLRDDAEATEELKQFRHEFGNLMKNFDWSDRLRCRETENDVGTAISAEGEYHRANLIEIFAANFCRLQESLRSIEEMTKLGRPDLSPFVESLRYRSYVIEKKLYARLKRGIYSSVRFQRREQMRESHLYVLLDSFFDLQKLEELFLAGVDVIQLRDKNASDRQILSTAERWRDLAGRCFPKDSKGRAPLMIMNDRPDLAVLAGFDGVHVGQEELTPAECRQIVGDDLLIGLSTHNNEQVRLARESDIDYIGAGPVFPSKTKMFKSFPGLDFLKEIADNEIESSESGDRDDPITAAFAIGGISETNLDLIISVGVRRAAFSSAVTESKNIKQSIEEMKLKFLKGQ